MKMKLCPGCFILCLLLLMITDDASSEDEYYYDDDLADAEDNNIEEDYFPIFDDPNESEEHWVPEDEWNRYWPPKRSDGRPIPATPEGAREWEIIAEEAKLRYKELEEMFQFSQDKKPRPYPFCVDGSLPKAFGVTSDHDPNLDNFRALFTLSQPRNGVPVISDRFGKTNIVHIEDGIDNGPYIQTVIIIQLF
jgi:hypothetical protein